MDETKKDLLCKLGRTLGGRSVEYPWGVGASVLLWGYGRIEDFDEVDIVVCRQGVRFLTSRMARLGPAVRHALPLPGYQADFYRSYLVDGVFVNVMSGLCIKSTQGEYVYRFDARSVPHVLKVGGVELPCTTLEEWKYLYGLSSGRKSELALIDSLFSDTGMIFKELYVRMRERR